MVIRNIFSWEEGLLYYSRVRQPQLFPADNKNGNRFVQKTENKRTQIKLSRIFTRLFFIEKDEYMALP